MPVVGRADQHDIQVLLLEHLAVIARRSAASSSTSAAGWRFPPRPRACACPRRKARPPRPARPGSAGTDRSCHTTRADQPDALGLAIHQIKRVSAIRRKCRQRRQRGCGLEKTASANVETRSGNRDIGKSFHAPSINHTARTVQAEARRCLNLSNPTARMMTNPIRISCINVGNPIWLEPLRRTAMISAPIIEPRMLPVPPFRLAPPMTTAAMISSSNPMAMVRSPWVSRDNCKIPARPKNKPASE